MMQLSYTPFRKLGLPGYFLKSFPGNASNASKVMTHCLAIPKIARQIEFSKRPISVAIARIILDQEGAGPGVPKRMNVPSTRAK